MSVIAPLTRRRLLEVAVAIQRHTLNGLGFNMGWWLRPEPRVPGLSVNRDRGGNPNFCGTVACIAGHAVVLAHAQRAPDTKVDRIIVMEVASNYSREISTAAADWLGLDPHSFGGDGDALFNAPDRDRYKFPLLEDVTAEQAIATLCAFAGTGYVDWKASPAKWNDPAAALAALGGTSDAE